MFRIHISSSFTHIFPFRLRIRCPARENASSPAPHPPKLSCPISSQPPEPNDNNSHSLPLSTHSRISGTPAPTPTHIIIIGQEQDTRQIVSPPSPEPILSDDVGSQSYTDGLPLVESQPINTHHVSFQVLPTYTHGSPSAASLCKYVAHAVEVEMETGRTVLPEITITSPTPAPDCDSMTEHTPRSSAIADAGLNGPPSDSDKARHRSLFVPQPVRADPDRLSMPARPAASHATMEAGHARESTPQSKRTSLLPIGPAAGSAWREKGNSRWSREMSKRETQEVLRAVSGF